MEKYLDGKPNIDEIKLVNKYYNIGHRIILWTGRNWDKYEITKAQLEACKIKHHELIMGKPQGVYVDVDSLKSLKEFKIDR